ncbi:MAG: AraC family transcriptional regulator [Planctomycetota bacterium]
MLAEWRLIERDQAEELDPDDVLICHDPLVPGALDFIRRQIHERIGVEDVVEHMETSRSTLVRRFDAALGRSVASEITRLRIHAVKQALTRTRRSIASISEAYGFSSPGQLSRVFKREVGVSPSEWRRGKRVPAGTVAY